MLVVDPIRIRVRRFSSNFDYIVPICVSFQSHVDESKS